jgi:hypothetical protein
MSNFRAVILLILAVVAGASAQAKHSAEIMKIDALVRRIDRIQKGKKIIVADIANFDQGKANWKVFESEKALDNFRDESETYTIAFNWRRNGKIAASNFTLFSPSGDWTKSVFHYFRPDGSLAVVKSELRTFYGEFIVKENRYFDTGGRLLKKTIGYYDLQSGKPKKPTKEMREDNPSLYRVDYFMNIKKLPFAKLIARRN